MFTIAALYHFTRFDDPKALQKPLAALACAQKITGTLLLAPEGINGTIAGPQKGVETVLKHIRTLPGCADPAVKFSQSGTRPFARLKVRLKREIVTMGQPDVDPTTRKGHYIDPQDWNALIADPNVAVIDTRNDYEVAIGTFQGAIDPKTARFRDFPAWWDANKARLEGMKIAMFCTGGIRCEKSTNYLLDRGVKDVFHLKGGILKYLEEVPQGQSKWHGSCFVFDGRVSVEHGLEPGPHELCHACRRPILPADRNHPDFEDGVACHQCAHQTTPSDKARFRMRQHQITLARTRGTRHLHADVTDDPDL